MWARTIDLDWDDRSGDETEFRVAISRDGGASWDNVGTTGVNTERLRVEGLQPGTRYLFKVRAGNGEGYSDYSNVVEVVTRGEPPAAPGRLREANTWSRRLDLNWDRPAGVEAVAIQISTDGTHFHEIGRVSADVERFRAEGLNPRTRYWFRAVGYNAAGQSPVSNVAEIVTRGEAPDAPGNLRQANVWARTIDVNWDRMPHADWYKVFRSVDGQNFVEVGAVGSDAAGFRLTDLRPGTRYFFRVLATNQFGDSGFSNTIEVTTRREAPTSPGNLRAANVWARTIDLNWDDRSNNESGFTVQISTNGSNFQEIGRTGPDAVRFRAESLRPNTQYWFRVLSFNEEGEVASNVIAVRTKP